MSVDSALQAWRARAEISENIAAWRTLPACPGEFETLPADIHPSLAAALGARGITRLYCHQAAAWREAQAGRHVVVVTGTASGKTLCYNMPIVDSLLRDREARALYLFPTKALAQDQRHELSGLLDDLGMPEAVGDGLGPAAGGSGRRAVGEGRALTVATYDGDTPGESRAAVRSRARLLISNPDMLHLGILPHHTLWAELLRRLRFVVIDEMHVYRGVFGSHVANVLRRLKRVCAFYGSSPQIMLTSATIANPAELAERLIEEPVVLVDRDGATRGARHFLMYNPPVVDVALGLRRSAMLESVALAADLVEHGVQTIVFARARRSAEIMLRYLSGARRPAGRSGQSEGALQADSSDAGPDDGRQIRGYRGGYLPAQRREIERGLRDGSVRAVVATNALELGIDIGGMGAAVMAGYPGTIAGTWQQAGRAGRQAEDSLAVLVASAAPLDQYLARHADHFFGRSPEQALIHADNLLILLQHLRCAAFELPFRAGDGFGRATAEQVTALLDLLLESGTLHLSGGRYYWMADQYPSSGVSLRSASADRVLLVAEGTTIGEVDLPSAGFLVHPGAVYMQEARSFQVSELDLDQKVARLAATEVDYFTEPRSQITVQLLEITAKARVPGGTKAHGEVMVTTQVTGFRKIRWFTHEVLGTGEVSLPPNELLTTGYWITLAEAAVADLRAQGLWSNDPNEYGPAWPAQRDRARARDGYRCQICGAAEAAAAHHVHHRVPFRMFAGPKGANDLSNLVTLCSTCHRQAELAVRVRSGLAGLGHVLAHMAPLFLMCDSRDVGVHSDPQSPLVDGAPVVVIYDRVPAGIGFSERLFELHGDLLARCKELVAACVCADGCPSCVGPPGENGLGGKQETLAILAALTGLGAAPDGSGGLRGPANFVPAGAAA